MIQFPCIEQCIFFLISLSSYVFWRTKKNQTLLYTLSRLYIMQHFERHLALHLENTQGTDPPLAHPNFCVVYLPIGIKRLLFYTPVSANGRHEMNISVLQGGYRINSNPSHIREAQ